MRLLAMAAAVLIFQGARAGIGGGFELPSLASDGAGSGATEAAATKRTDYWRIELAHRAKLHDEYLADQAQRERDGYAAIMAAREQDKQDALASLAYRAEQHEEYLRQQEDAERAAFDAMMAERARHAC